MQRPAKPWTPVRLRLQPQSSPGGGTGRRKGLKIPRKVTFVPVRFRPRAIMMFYRDTTNLHIAMRFALSGRYNAFAKLIQRLSVIGIGLGVCVLIVVSSIFNGFRIEITESLGQISPHLIITHENHWWNNWEEIKDRLSTIHNIKSIRPMLRTYGMIAGRYTAPPVQLIQASNGLRNNSPTDILEASLSPDLQEDLWLMPNDTFGVITATKHSSKPVNIRLRVNQDDVTHKNMMDHRSVHIKGNALTRALKLPKNTITELDIDTRDILTVDQTINTLRTLLPQEIQIHNTSQKFTSLLASLRMQKKLMVIVFSLVVLTAAFNLVTSLVMMVTERKKEIALLRTLGLRKNGIIQIFIIQSIALAASGVMIGLIMGIIVSRNISSAMEWCEQWLGQKIMSKQVWMLDHLPAVIDGQDVVTICTGSIILAIIAAWYPAWIASRIDPADVLRYE